MVMSFNVFSDKLWKKICEIHEVTKRYSLIAEEISEDGSIFLQPMKEHRDAYDHMLRVLNTIIGRKRFPDNALETSYISSNLSKAYGHEYRAFYDTADWISFYCRKFIRDSLNSIPEERRRELPNFDEIRADINTNIPLQVAELRNAKDIGISSTQTGADGNEDLVSKYCKVLDTLIEYRRIVSKFTGRI